MHEVSRTAIVTGAGRGIGAALARRLGADGFATIVNYAASADAARAVADAIGVAGGKAMAVKADVADPAQMRALFDTAEAAFGPVDVLVNNAGVAHPAPLAEVEDADYRRQIDVNLTGSFNGMREGARRIRDGGRIINLSTSIIGRYLPAHGVYVATKAAIEGMTCVLAKELGPRRISVNAVAPGPVGTELFLTGRSRELIDRMIADIPMGRLGTPDDIAAVAAFLAGPDSGWISGQIIKANGARN